MVWGHALRCHHHNLRLARQWDKTTVAFNQVNNRPAAAAGLFLGVWEAATFAAAGFFSTTGNSSDSRSSVSGASDACGTAGSGVSSAWLGFFLGKASFGFGAALGLLVLLGLGASLGFLAVCAGGSSWNPTHLKDCPNCIQKANMNELTTSDRGSCELCDSSSMRVSTGI